MVFGFFAHFEFRRERSFSLYTYCSAQASGETTMTFKENDSPLASKIDGILEKEPSKECLFALLKLTTPTLTEQELLDDESSRDAAMSKLVHDVSAMDPAKVNKVTAFMSNCTGSTVDQKVATGKRKANPNSPPPPSPLAFPEKFHVHDKWPFLNIDTLHPTHYTDIHARKHVLAAVHCIDARGTIAHQKQVETPVTLSDEIKDFSLEQVFHKMGGGFKCLHTIEAIQTELMKNGPVVSTSFVPYCDYPMANHPAALISSASPEKHPVLIVGWERQGFVNYWLAKRLSDGTQTNNCDPTPLRIAMKQFHIDDECVAPLASLQDVSWQHGPYFDVVRLPEGWMEYPNVNLRISLEDRETLVRKHDILNKPIVVRDKYRKAHSRRYAFHALVQLKEKGQFSLSLDKVD